MSLVLELQGLKDMVKAKVRLYINEKEENLEENYWLFAIQY